LFQTLHIWTLTER